MRSPTANSARAQIEALDPERDYELIHRLTRHDVFPWDSTRALELALFHALAVPSISALLERTGEFAERGQKRYDDTVLLLHETCAEGLESQRGRAAVRRLNWIHSAYEISNAEYLYVLATFVVLPVRFSARYGWRPYTETETRAAVNTYRHLGRAMGITDIPENYEEFESYLEVFERDQHAFTPAGHRLAVATIGTFQAWFARPLRPLIRRYILVALDSRVRSALGLPRPSAPERACVWFALSARAWWLSRAPLARSGARPRVRPRRSYPDGYTLSDLGPESLRRARSSPELLRTP